MLEDAAIGIFATGMLGVVVTSIAEVANWVR
jgi:hypothetical protein